MISVCTKQAVLSIIRNHHVQNQNEGPAFLQMNNTSYDKLIKAPVSGYNRLTKILRPGDVYVFRCYDGELYAKLVVLEIID